MVNWKIKLKAKTKGIILLIGLFPILLVSFQNCSALRSPNGDGSASNSSLSEQEILGQQAIEILSAKCLTCHNPEKPEGDVGDITDLNYLLYYRLVIPGQPEISDIVRVIKEGTMPPTGGVSTEEIQVLNKWIMEGLIDSSGNIAVPGVSATLEPTFSSIKSIVLNVRCVRCHSAGNAADGISFDTYASTLATVTPTNPNGSRLVQSLERLDGNNPMPQGGPRLLPAQIAAIRLWIQNGAANN